MKNTIKVFVLVALTLAAMSVSAQVKLGHIETQKLIQAMPEWTAAQKTFEEEQKKVNTELNGLREQFQTKLAEYSEKMKTYSEAMRATTEEELQGLQQRIQRFQETAMAQLEKTQNDLMQPVMEKALNAIKEVGKENGFTYIFDMNAGILYAAENSQDVLPLVKKKLGLAAFVVSDSRIWSNTKRVSAYLIPATEG